MYKMHSCSRVLFVAELFNTIVNEIFFLHLTCTQCIHLILTHIFSRQLMQNNRSKDLNIYLDLTIIDPCLVLPFLTGGQEALYGPVPPNCVHWIIRPL